MYKLRLDGPAYKFFPWVHVSRLKKRAESPDRPTISLAGAPDGIPDDDDFDAALLPEDSWEPDEAADEYEVEAILDVRWEKTTRTAKRTKKYLVRWVGYDEADWVDASQLNCGRLQYEFDKSQRAQARLAAMQADEGLHQA
jgi:hypothetical protein